MSLGKFMTVHINKTVDGFAAGQDVRVEIDGYGTPISPMWRRRLKDAEIDGCCEVVSDAGHAKTRKTRKRDKSATPSAEAGSPPEQYESPSLEE